MPGPDPLPLIRPMLATAGELPAPAQEDRWAYEMKWDGVRVVAYLDGGELRLLSRSDREVSAILSGPGRPGGSVRRSARSCWTARWSPSTRRAGRASASCRPG